MVQQKIQQKIQQKFPNSTHIDVINESYMHSVPSGSETHFKVVIVSPEFDSKSLLERHRMINELLADELKSGVHALSILAKTPEQWNLTNQKVEQSPNCMGGMKREQIQKK